MGAEIGGANSVKSEPNVVPLCDILLVLLIIFMILTPMIREGANVTLPEASNVSNQPKPGEMLTVDLKKDGTVYFKDKIVEDLTKLAALITATGLCMGLSQVANSPAEISRPRRLNLAVRPS